MKISILVIAGLTAIFLFGSCVAKKKLVSANNQIASLRQDSAKLAENLSSTREELYNTKQKNESLQKGLDELTAENAQKDKVSPSASPFAPSVRRGFTKANVSRGILLKKL